MLDVNVDVFSVTSPFKLGSGMDMAGGIDSLYIFSDVVQTKLVGDVSVHLLRKIPISPKHDSMCQSNKLLQNIVNKLAITKAIRKGNYKYKTPSKKIVKHKKDVFGAI